MRNIHIDYSYYIWNIADMKFLLDEQAYYSCGTFDAEHFLNRTYKSMYIEWWLHNIGYYITLPLRFIPCFKKLNERFRDIDLEEWTNN